MHVGFIPCLPYLVTQYRTAYTTLCSFLKIQTHLNESSVKLICDEGVFCIVVEIVLQQLEQFKCLISMTGGFHMAKALLHSVGRFMKINGLFGTLIENGTFGVKTAEKLQMVPTM